MTSEPHLFAIIPAAGRSRRMGRPKLTLPLGDRSVIRRLLDALDRPEITQCIVVHRRSDEELFAEVSATNAAVVRPEVDPPDMRASVQHALDFIAENYEPNDNDAWLLVPADHPVLDGRLIDELIQMWRLSTAKILIPTHDGKRGHPTFFRWPLAEAVRQLPQDRGLNALIEQFAESVKEVPVETDGILTDLDTPADYARLQDRFG